jgi:hypothetical protein
VFSWYKYTILILPQTQENPKSWPQRLDDDRATKEQLPSTARTSNNAKELVTVNAEKGPSKMVRQPLKNARSSALLM